MPTKTIPQQKQQRPAQFIPPPQQPKNTLAHLTEFPLSPTPSPLSPISTPKLLSQSHSATRDSTSLSSSSSNTQQRAKSASKEVRRALNAFYFCEDALESPTLERHEKQTLQPLAGLKTIDHKDITNPYLFRGAPEQPN